MWVSIGLSSDDVTIYPIRNHASYITVINSGSAATFARTRFGFETFVAVPIRHEMSGMASLLLHFFGDPVVI